MKNLIIFPQNTHAVHMGIGAWLYHCTFIYNTAAILMVTICAQIDESNNCIVWKYHISFAMFTLWLNYYILMQVNMVFTNNKHNFKYLSNCK